MSCSQCSSTNRNPCPIFLNSNCITYDGRTLPNIGVTTNERLNSILSKIDDKFGTPSSGGVTSVAFSGGTTGFTASGSPITTSGTITLSGTLIPANGGTGKTTYTPYALIAGGTSATSTLQQIASLGTTGQILTSNGAGALPTWQNAIGGGTVTNISGVNTSTFSWSILNSTSTPAITLSLLIVDGGTY